MGNVFNVLIPHIRLRYVKAEMGEGVQTHSIVFHFVWLAIYSAVTLSFGSISALYQGDDHA